MLHSTLAVEKKGGNKWYSLTYIGVNISREDVIFFPLSNQREREPGEVGHYRRGMMVVVGNGEAG
jgi:hypothetical protein